MRSGGRGAMARCSRPKVVAVLPFCPDAGERDRLVATEACENGVRAAGVEVVARERVVAAMAEGRVGIANEANAASIARRVGADAAIVGRVQPRQFGQDLVVRLIRAENGAVDGAAAAESPTGVEVCRGLLSGGAALERP